MADRGPVGFVGLKARSGAPIAQAVAEAGWPLVVWADDPTTTAALEDAPATTAATLQDLAAACEVVVFRDVEDDAVERLVAGLVAGMRPGGVVVNNRPRGKPSELRQWAERGRVAGVFVLDAMTSGPAGGPGGKPYRSMMVGGDRAAFERSRAILEATATSVLHMGGPGAGELAKLFNTLVYDANVMVVAGMLELGERLGLELEALVELIRVSSGGSYALEALVRPDMVNGSVEEYGMDWYLSMFRGRLADLSADARDLDIPPSRLEGWARDGIEELPAVIDRLAPLRGEDRR